MSLLFVVAAVLILTAFSFVLIYNRLVRLRNLVREAWSGIDVQLKRRHDLIPNLVETVRGYSAHEKSLLTDLTKIRQTAVNAGGIIEKAAAENALSARLRGLLAVAEAYPDLKASTTFLELQRSVSAVEDDLQLSRRYYNGTVRDLNVALQTFPSNLIGGAFGYAPEPYFEITTATERESPETKI